MKVDLTLIERVDKLISTKSTGSPKQFADKLGLSLSSWHNVRMEMQKRGAPIEYSKILRSYRYVEEGGFSVNFLRKLGS